VKGSSVPYGGSRIELILFLPEGDRIGCGLKEYTGEEYQYREIESSHVKTLRKFVLMEEV
jgi:hypothetical protein